ncbi:MAG TPA: hypothetical protein VJM46_01945 [Candidatus Saccharimonadales bacterium]|nr:hypothetical protein [Candidatus Saccharimonadales bacterium]
MNFAVSACVTEMARLMVELTSTPSADSTRRLSSLHAAVLSQVTSTAVLMELRGQYGSRFTPSLGEWNEVGLDADGSSVLYKLAKPTATYYFTIREGTVCRLARAT